MGVRFKRFTPPDAMTFLLMDSRRRPMHMGGLQMFARPEGADDDFVRRTYEEMRTCLDVAPMFAGHPSTVRGRPFGCRPRLPPEVHDAAGPWQGARTVSTGFRLARSSPRPT